MNIAAVEDWLGTHTGLAANKLGPGQVARIARDRIRATGCVDAPGYAALLAASPEEQLCFIEAIVVTETWFFRERAALDGLVRHVSGPWAERHAVGPFWLLSVPCSTGEEPYSIAMALALAHWPAARLQIDAVDISRESLARAAEGIYRKNSFRGADLAFREIFFDAEGTDAWRIRPPVRAPVRFQEANLLGDSFVAGRPRYDAIFCRNLLIYFDPPVQARVFRALWQLLADDGLLAVGPAEAPLGFEHGFSPAPGGSSSLLQKARAKSALARVAAPRIRTRATPPARPSSGTAGGTPRHAPALPGRAPEVSPLQQLRALADAGRLREARELGDALLRAGGPSIELCYLLAVVADAGGDPRRAEEFYRKALYLDPRHAESLAHLALLLEKNGDTRAAATLRLRARREPAGSSRRETNKEIA